MHVLTVASSIVVFAQDGVTFEPDRPWLRVKLSDTADLKCCFTKGKSVKFTWVKHCNNASTKSHGEQNVEISDRVTTTDKVDKNKNIVCGYLNFKSVELNDTGMYQCRLNVSTILFSHGTYLQVYSEYVYLCVVVEGVLFAVQTYQKCQYVCV